MEKQCFRLLFKTTDFSFINNDKRNSIFLLFHMNYGRTYGIDYQSIIQRQILSFILCDTDKINHPSDIETIFVLSPNNKGKVHTKMLTES